MGKFDGVILFSDMDGTLLDSNGEISAPNRAAVAYFIENGGKFSLATGRAKRAMQYYLERIPVNAPVIVHNGAVVYDFQHERAVSVRAVGMDGYHMTLDVMERFPGLGVEVYLVDEEYVVRSNPITQRHMEYIGLPHRTASVQDIPQPWVRLNYTMDQPEIGQVTAYLNAQYGDKFCMQHSLPYFYEVMARDANKGTGVRAVCEHLGLTDLSHVYAIGDALNDIELLESTPNAYAPANAHEKVLGLVRGVLADNDHAAVAQLIELLDKTY